MGTMVQNSEVVRLPIRKGTRTCLSPRRLPRTEHPLSTQQPIRTDRQSTTCFSEDEKAGCSTLCPFCKGSGFEFSFHAIQTIELTSLLLINVEVRDTVACVISKKARILLASLH